MGSAQEVGSQEEDQVFGWSLIGEEGAGFVLVREGGDGEVIEGCGVGERVLMGRLRVRIS